MKLKVAALTLLPLIVSSYASASVELQIPKQVDVLLVNGEKPDLFDGFFSSKESLTLPNGENQILFTYKPYFDQGKDRSILESNATIGTFTAADTKLEFVLPNYRNEQEGMRKIKDLQWGLNDINGKAIEVRQDTLTKDGIQFGRNFQDEMTKYNRNGGSAAITISASLMTQQTPSQSMNVDPNTAEEMLHFWYQKADIETQKRFKLYINQK
ncbi:DUF2057 family protein [Vibrio caribbeanicus]|uniref:DUF2057 family protein n=1 Tax=Vibrio caribbeanicus TaxID=701175 RepID=UPI0022851D30|nr:DUF2057 family protein [Vibrio caribbeanicus]MCY9844142.1 DUF2057 family protein [Vibrio caribbeanicus]